MADAIDNVPELPAAELPAVDTAIVETALPLAEGLVSADAIDKPAAAFTGSVAKPGRGPKPGSLATKTKAPAVSETLPLATTKTASSAAPVVKSPPVKTPVAKVPKARTVTSPVMVAPVPAIPVSAVPAPAVVVKRPVGRPKKIAATIAAAPSPKVSKVPAKKAVAPVVKLPVAKLPIAQMSGSKKPFSPTSFLKEKAMTTTTNAVVEGLKSSVSDVQVKAKAAFDKSTAAFGDVNEFAKGNVEAMVEAGKIVASGLQEMSTSYVAETRSAFEALTADVKELAAVKSPTDFFKLQSELMKKSFESAMAYGSKNSEAMLKLANDAIAPISSRVSIAVDKMKVAA